MANDKYVTRLQQKYVDEVAPALFKKYGYASAYFNVIVSSFLTSPVTA